MVERLDIRVDVPGERVELLDGGAAAFPRMLAAIETARRRIHLEVYAFEHDDVGDEFVEALSAAARRHVEVSVVLDGWGSALSGRYVQAALEAAGADVRVYNPLVSLLWGHVRRNHRKILLVDDEVAFLGGINIGAAYRGSRTEPGWADLALELHGPICAALGRKLRGEKGPAVHSSTHVFLSGLGGGGPLRKRYLKAIGRAQRRVRIAHAYFLPDRRFVRSLTAAARRGVDVALLLAGRSDVPFAHAATMRLYRQLLKAGVRIVEWRDSVLHAKAAVIDGSRLLLGSFNLDPLSLANLEALVELDSGPAVEQTEAWIETKLATGGAITECRRRPLEAWFLDVMGLVGARVAQFVSRLASLRRA